MQDFQRLLIREGRALSGDEVTYILHLGQAELRFPGVGGYVVLAQAQKHFTQIDKKVGLGGCMDEHIIDAILR